MKEYVRKKQRIPYSGMFSKVQGHNETEMYGVDIVSVFSRTNLTLTLLL